ncbi:hypothetical protein RN001_011644 [Aquatica leii]|uniref:Peptidase metallopeptidase domain-containing protein n=1 Tax=Aquatica leii TaxID=1421715 RepID=A0AAN7SCX6_9COLE|nr:hypothetical protein RN001_011644 [Aquatica leii]
MSSCFLKLFFMVLITLLINHSIQANNLRQNASSNLYNILFEVFEHLDQNHEGCIPIHKVFQLLNEVDIPFDDAVIENVSDEYLKSLGVFEFADVVEFAKIVIKMFDDGMTKELGNVYLMYDKGVKEYMGVGELEKMFFDVYPDARKNEFDEVVRQIFAKNCIGDKCTVLRNVILHPLPATRSNYHLPTSQTFEFMKRYGYLEDTPNSEALYTEDAIRDVIKNVQKFGGIDETGIIDNATLALMKSPRCGVPDILRNSRSKRYALGSKGWRKRHITYHLSNWSPRLGESVVADNIQKALDIWGRYGRLTFTRVNDVNADIIVFFARGPHGDNFPFDGPGEVLAHAFFPSEYPGRGGDIHFDEEEEWSIHTKVSQEGTDFFTVAFHELGHSLGLSHSPVTTSIMFPYYQGYADDLDYDDILGMYALYIQGLPDTAPHYNPPREPVTPRTPSSTESSYDEDEDNADEDENTDTVDTNNIDDTNDNDENNSYPESTEITTFESEEQEEKSVENEVPSLPKSTIPDICEGDFDAVAMLREELFIFKDEYFWRLKERLQIEPGYPAKINQMFPLPSTVLKLDAIYERPDGMIILFSDNQFWVYNGIEFIENSPQPLSKYGIAEYVDKIDAALNWEKNGKTYLFKDDRFWRYNEETQTLDEGYPMHIDRWRGVPEKLDAATTWKDGKTYFFKGKFYWAYDTVWASVTDSSPLPAPQTWLGCPEKEFIRAYFSKKPK